MVTLGQLIVLMLAISSLMIGGGISLARLRVADPRLAVWSRWLLLAAAAFCGVVLCWHIAARSDPRWLPIDDNFEALIWLGLLLMLFVMYTQAHKPLAGLEWFVMPIAVVLLISAAVFGRAKPDAYVDTTWSTVHRITAYGGAVAFFIAGATGGMYLLANRRLRSKLAFTGPPMASLEKLESVSYNCVILGFALLTIGLVTGVVKIVKTHGHTRLGDHWAASPKVWLTVVVWVIYALVLHSPMTPSFRGRKVALLSIVGCVLMVTTLIAVQFMPGGR